ncbi:hypothetical protein CCH79_00018444 [Gambusia affinis]|uniref:Uncharacterized protein n=1 Tax=Gambusia affinis TaxID=33528 RepID=A0A315VD37_GAMAF|nr:hypothetical protein CCH79_00018444 [Gambusia affinis]
MNGASPCFMVTDKHCGVGVERPVRPSAETAATATAATATAAAAAASESPVSIRFAARAHTHQMKSVQWLQKVGCLKKRAMNLWFFTSCTFFWRRAPWRAKPRALSGTSPSLLGGLRGTRGEESDDREVDVTEAAGQNESGCRYLLLLLLFLLTHLLRLSSPLAASVSVARAAGDFYCLRPPRVCCCCFRRLCFPVLKVSLLAALYLRRKQAAALVARAATDIHTCARRAPSIAAQQVLSLPPGRHPASFLIRSPSHFNLRSSGLFLSFPKDDGTLYPIFTAKSSHPAEEAHFGHLYFCHDPCLLVIGAAYKMPTSPVKTRVPLSSFGHLITEVKKQLFGIKGPSSVQLTGWRKYFNSYTLQGRRNITYVSLEAHRTRPCSALLSELCVRAQFTLTLHGASERTWLLMSQWERADDGEPACENRRNRCSGRMVRDSLDRTSDQNQKQEPAAEPQNPEESHRPERAAEKNNAENKESAGSTLDFLLWCKLKFEEESESWRLPETAADADGLPTHIRPFASFAEYRLIKLTYLQLQESGFYWGPMTMEEAHQRLTHTSLGTFLLR